MISKVLYFAPYIVMNIMKVLESYPVSLPTHCRKYNLRPLQMGAQLGREPAQLNNEKNTVVRVVKVQMYVNFTHD